MTFMQRLSVLRQRARAEEGFTIFELVSAVTLSAVVSLATVSILISVTGNVGQSQANTAVAAQTESVMTNFSRAIRGAETFDAFTAQSVIFITENGSTCERHHYQFAADDVNPGRMVLRHSVAAVQIPTGAGCESVLDSLRNGSVSPLNDSIEIRSLHPTSAFSLYADNGQKIPALGTSAYQPEADLPNCKIAAVDLALNNVLTTSKGATVTQENSARVALLNNVRGLTC